MKKYNISNLIYVVSVTTRKPRRGEVNGSEYIFVNDEEFDLLIEDDKFIEWVYFAGFRYGTLYESVNREDNCNVFLEIDINGVFKVTSKIDNCISIFMLPPTESDLMLRLKKRSSESINLIKERLKIAKKELSLVDKFDHKIVNVECKDSAYAIKNIILDYIK